MTDEQRLEKQLEEEQRIRDLRNQELEDIKTIMATKAGRRFFWRLLSVANIFRSCFTGNSKTFYLEGQRDVGLVFWQDLMEACPKSFDKMRDENFPKSEELNG